MSLVIEWSWYIALYLFLGGLGAGTYLTSAVADIKGKGRYEAFSRFGAHLTWPIIIIGTILLIIDLGRPELGRPYHIFNVFNNPISMITIGTILLIGLILISMLTSFLWLARWEMTWLRLVIQLVGSVLAAGVAVYTGLLLSLARGSPFWVSPILPWLFTISAASTGLVLVGLASSTLGLRLFPRFSVKPEVEALSTVERIDGRLIMVELVTLVLYLGTVSLTRGVEGEAARRGLTYLLTGTLSPVFWGVVIAAGMLIPLLLGTYGLEHLKRTNHLDNIPLMAMITFILVLIGGLFLRYIILIVGQI